MAFIGRFASLRVADVPRLPRAAAALAAANHAIELTIKRVGPDDSALTPTVSGIEGGLWLGLALGFRFFGGAR